MDHAKNRSEKSTQSSITKDMIGVFSSFTFVCFAIIFALLVYDILTIQNLLSFDRPMESFMILGVSSIALLLFGVILTFTMPSNYIDGTNHTYQDDSLPRIFTFMFIAALFEETLFRGIIQNVLFLYTSHEWLAILLTTGLFLVFHIQYFKKPIMLLNISVPSVVFGWIYFKTNNLLVPIFVHFIMNIGMTILFKYNLIRFKK
ncbi:CPBP family intramembrane glutamic endopeptidase [Sporosarcina sp. P7]|uniref:CPBP family intramembrane glutamic endopeptidase n=1 Tax=Sporosarcina sp. P7 TaxID=2048244 RepID=UPI000C170EC3|nr:CPBP family intramembrane glutamic endopeptidase [Sporosarcina sp. P7]PID24574.1 CPBP family intramembrane metalloprotease [Sporosarcina sp. P7]